jgi:hypothetical protein
LLLILFQVKVFNKVPGVTRELGDDEFSLSVFQALAPRSSLESPLAAANTAGEGGCRAPAAVVTAWRAPVHRLDLIGGRGLDTLGEKDSDPSDQVLPSPQPNGGLRTFTSSASAPSVPESSSPMILLGERRLCCALCVRSDRMMSLADVALARLFPIKQKKVLDGVHDESVDPADRGGKQCVWDFLATYAMSQHCNYSKGHYYATAHLLESANQFFKDSIVGWTLCPYLKGGHKPPQPLMHLD